MFAFIVISIDTVSVVSHIYNVKFTKKKTLDKTNYVFSLILESYANFTLVYGWYANCNFVKFVFVLKYTILLLTLIVQGVLVVQGKFLYKVHLEAKVPF